MSCDWDVRCMDCGEDLGVPDANNRDDVMRTLIGCADALATLGAALIQVDNANQRTSIECEVSVSGYRFDPLWFAQHSGHKLRPVNEYGELDEQCGEWVKCECGAQQRCKLDVGHDGEHARAP